MKIRLYLFLIIILMTNTLHSETNKNINKEIEKYFSKLKGNSIPYLIEVITKSAKPAKIAAIRKLGEFKNSKAKEVLVAVLCYIWNPSKFEEKFIKKKGLFPSFDADVRSEAAISLAKMGGNETVDIIGNTLLADRNSKVKQFCAKALSILKNKNGIKYLQKAIKYELSLDITKVDEAVIKESVKALGKIGGKDGFFILIEVTQSDKLSYDTKKEALKSLEKIKWE